MSFVIVYIYQFIGIIFVSHSIILMEAYALYLMIVAGSHLDILAHRLATVGHETNRLQTDNPNYFDALETSFRVDCIQAYTNISRFDALISLKAAHLLQYFKSNFCFVFFSPYTLKDSKSESKNSFPFQCFFNLSSVV